MALLSTDFAMWRHPRKFPRETPSSPYPHFSSWCRSLVLMASRSFPMDVLALKYRTDPTFSNCFQLLQRLCLGHGVINAVSVSEWFRNWMLPEFLFFFLLQEGVSLSAGEKSGKCIVITQLASDKPTLRHELNSDQESDDNKKNGEYIHENCIFRCCRQKWVHLKLISIFRVAFAIKKIWLTSWSCFNYLNFFFFFTNCSSYWNIYEWKIHVYV